MSDWYDTFDAVFWITIGTLVTGFLGMTLKYALKSKCEDCSICYGLVTIKRRVDLEAEVEEKELELAHNAVDDSPAPLESSQTIAQKNK